MRSFVGNEGFNQVPIKAKMSKLKEKTESDRERVKSNRRICKGNDTGCGLYRKHG